MKTDERPKRKGNAVLIPHTLKLDTAVGLCSHCALCVASSSSQDRKFGYKNQEGPENSCFFQRYSSQIDGCFEALSRITEQQFKFKLVSLRIILPFKSQEKPKREEKTKTPKKGNQFSSRSHPHTFIHTQIYKATLLFLHLDI